MNELGKAIAEALRLEQINVALGRFLLKVKCRLGFHAWDLYSGFYEERVAKGAHCMDCGACYDT